MPNLISSNKNQSSQKGWWCTARVKISLILLIVCFLGGSLLNACVTAPSPAPDTPDLSIPLTNAAQTADARATLNAGQTAVAQLTMLAASPTLAPAAPTSPSTAPPTETPLPASPTLPPIPCYRAEVIADLSAPPNALLPVGASFVKTWRMRNSGACPWTPQFSLVLSGGDPMGSTTIHSLGNQVAPGESLNLSIGLTAPGFPGIHQGNWFLRSTEGEMFGSGINAETPLQVIINTVQPLTLNTNTFDLTFDMCSAIWESGSGVLGCPGNRSDLQGSISLLSQPALESRLASGFALLMRPNLAVDGWITGQFPAYFVRSNDHFMAEIGCLTGSPNCRLTFRLEYRATDGSSGRLGNWRETFDGQTTLIDVDLSNLAGKAIQLIFSVENMGVAENANAFWLLPRILNQTPTSNLVLTWTREGFPAMPCSELRVFLNNAGQGEAWAISCSPYSYELGRTSLSALEVRQLTDWIQLLRSFDAEISRSSPVTPIIIWLRFEGTGINDAGDPDLQAINAFATRLFDQIAP